MSQSFKTKMLFAAVLALVANVADVAYADDPGKTLAVPLYGQETNVWCWDAASLMVIKYFRPSSQLTQCTIATQGTPGQSCCASPTPAPCVHTGWEMLSANGFSFSSSGTALSFADLVSQISAKKPVMYAVGWSGGGGHMMVATGWSVVGNVAYVSVNNPWPPNAGAQELQTYDYWVGGPWFDHVTWTHFYNITDTQKFIPYKFKLPLLAKVRPWRPIPDPAPDWRKLVVPNVLSRASVTLRQMQLTTPETLRRLGLSNRKEAAGATLGTPLQEFDVPLSALAGFTPKTSAVSILTGGTTYFFPIVIKGTLRSSIRVAAGRDGTPTTIAIGDTGSAAHLGRLRDLGATLRQRTSTSLPVVRVPALGLFFVVRTEKERFLVASIFDVPTLSLKAGNFEDATQVFARIAPMAKNVQGVM